MFINGLDTPVEKVYNNKESFYHIAYRHSSFAYEKNYVNTIKNILVSPDEIYKTKDRFDNVANAYLKYIDSSYYLAVVRDGNIVTSYIPTANYLEKIRKGVKIL